MYKQTPTVPMDFSEVAFNMAVGMLEVSPDQVEILVPATEAVRAYDIQRKYGCKVVLIPLELLKTQFSWAVRTTSAMVWSPGAG